MNDYLYSDGILMKMCKDRTDTEDMLKSLLYSYFNPWLTYRNRFNNCSAENPCQFIDFICQKCYGYRYYVRFDVKTEMLFINTEKLLQVIFHNYFRLSAEELPDEIKHKVSQIINALYGSDLLLCFDSKKGSVISYLLLLYEIEIFEALRPFVYWNWQNEYVVLFRSHKDALDCISAVCEVFSNIDFNFKQLYFGIVIIDGFSFRGFVFKSGTFSIDEKYVQNFIEHVSKLTRSDRYYKCLKAFVKQINRFISRFANRYKHIRAVTQFKQIDLLIGFYIINFLNQSNLVQDRLFAKSDLKMIKIKSLVEFCEHDST